MDYFLKRYKQVCKEEFSEYGFKPYRNTHYRVINDVFQSFCLHRSIYGKNCTVEFGIFPLSYGYPLQKDSCRGDQLKDFDDSRTWFEYDNRSEITIEKCLAEMLVYMKKYLMPFFERAIDCKSAYQEICNFERKHYHEGCILFDARKLYMSLKNGDYENATIHVKAHIKHTKEVCAEKKEAFGEISPEYEKKIRISLEKDNKMLEHILNNDRAFIENLLAENERRNLESLKWKVPIVKK